MPYVTHKEVEGVNDLKGRRYDALLLSSAIAALMAGAATPADAQVAPVELEGIIIEGGTLSGEPTDAATLGSATTVITGEELERRQIRHAADALRTVPGLAVNRTGGVGGLTQVRVRGAEGNQVKVIIDGVEMGSLDFGEFDFATLLAADIERIEVIRGPQSGIYGANALAGVINIVTRKGTREPQVSARVEGGSFNTYGVSANASGAGEFGYLSVSAAQRETDGFNIAQTGSEEDGSEQKTIFARAGFSPTSYFRIDAMGRYQENDTEIDNFNAVFDPATNSTFDDGILDDATGLSNLREQTLGRISAELDLFDKRWSQKVFADYLGEDFFSKRDGSVTNSNFGDRSRYGYLSTLRLSTDIGAPASHIFVGLVENISENFESQFGVVARSRETAAYAGEYQGSFSNQLFVTGNIRHDDKDSFEDATTYRLSGAYIFRGTDTRFHASYGKGITDPTFFEQFGFALNFQGNPNLTPEESVGWDIGVEQKFLDGMLTADVTYFEGTLTDEIVSSGQTVINQTGESERQGVEVTLNAQVTANLAMTGTYTFTDATDPDGTQEIRRPRHSGSLGANYSFDGGRGQIGLTAIYNGEMKDNQFGGTFDLNTFDFTGFSVNRTLDDYLLVNVAASYKLDDNFELFGRVENLLDQDYEEVFGYSTAPISAYGGLRVTLGEADAPLEPELK